MIDASFIQKILEISNPTILHIGDRAFSTKQLFKADPSLQSLSGITLSGLLKMLTPNVKDTFIHVKSPTEVNLHEAVDKNLQYPLIYAAAPALPKVYFNERMEQEAFVIWLQSAFAPTPDLTRLLELVSQVTAGPVATVVDNGISQEVSTKAGVALKASVQCPPIVHLAPYRTFSEVSQVTSCFLFRVHQRDGNMPTFSLNDTQGDMWKVQAVKSISMFLEASLNVMGVKDVRLIG